MERWERGRDSEAFAAQYLTGLGWRIVRANFRARGGEIDLIARDGPELVFVEVRYRASSAFGLPEETVDRRKRLRIVRAARQFLGSSGGDCPCRFDVVALAPGPPGPYQVRHYRNAFDVDGRAG